jgi:peptide/nickel transport system permease protein
VNGAIPETGCTLDISVDPRYILRRLGTSALVLLGAVTLTFFLSRLISANPISAWLGKGGNPELIAIYTETYHLNEPLYVQYFYYIYGLIHLDFGYSPSRHEPVAAALSQTWPYTLQLMFFSMIFTVILGIVGGLLSAKYAGRAPEKAIKVSYIASTSSPPFLVPLILVLVFTTLVPILPTNGPIDPGMPIPTRISGIPMVDAVIEGNWPVFASLIQHVMLPSIAIALTLYGFLTRIVSSSITEVLGSNFVRAARARGVSEKIVLYSYGLKNSMLEVITMISLLLTFALVNDVFVENICSYPGLGQYAVISAIISDYPGILATTLVFATVIVASNLVADLLYFTVDPRVRTRR